ncbi:MAG: KilA-N domain-containing protein, partial [Mediterranea sp.]|nr:KilA-N domain-containing protein [Mediterranea sp.]
MAKMNIITVQNVPISISVENNDDYICLTDMVKGKDGDDHIRNWMRNRNTIEFLGAWEHLHNSNFKGVEFDTFLHEAGANRFNMTPRKWIEATNAVGIISKAG